MGETRKYANDRLSQGECHECCYPRISNLLTVVVYLGKYSKRTERLLICQWRTLFSAGGGFLFGALAGYAIKKSHENRSGSCPWCKKIELLLTSSVSKTTIAFPNLGVIATTRRGNIHEPQMCDSCQAFVVLNPRVDQN